MKKEKEKSVENLFGQTAEDFVMDGVTHINLQTDEEYANTRRATMRYILNSNTRNHYNSTNSVYNDTKLDVNATAAEYENTQDNLKPSPSDANHYIVPSQGYYFHDSKKVIYDSPQNVNPDNCDSNDNSIEIAGDIYCQVPQKIKKDDGNSTSLIVDEYYSDPQQLIKQSIKSFNPNPNPNTADLVKQFNFNDGEDNTDDTDSGDKDNNDSDSDDNDINDINDNDNENGDNCDHKETETKNEYNSNDEESEYVCVQTVEYDPPLTSPRRPSAYTIRVDTDKITPKENSVEEE
eukprot:Pgem_evm1s19892